MLNLGDFLAGASVHLMFTTHQTDGAPVAPNSAFEIADIRVYKDDSGTQRTSSSGMTMTSPFGSVTGLHHVKIDLSDNTDAGFWAAGHDYFVVLVPDETVDGVAVTNVVGMFSIERVKAQVVAALNTDTYAEPGQEAPGATISLAKKIGYLYKFLRNKKTQDASTFKLFADDGTTVDQKGTRSDDTVTYTEEEIVSGP